MILTHIFPGNSRRYIKACMEDRMSKLITAIKTVKILDAETRKMAHKVIEEVYLQEKKWIFSIEDQIPEELVTNRQISWFLATVNGEPAGVLRLYYDPVLELPEEYEVTLEKNIDLKQLASLGKFVEIGRFAILPKYRRLITVALRLMRIAINEVVSRDYTHFITDVFENEPNSPFSFHTRILGFEVIGRHVHGELNCSYTRIILTLDILKAYRLLKERRSRFYYSLTEGLRNLLDSRLKEKVY